MENLRWCRWWWWTSEIKLWRNRFSRASANSIPAFRKHAFPRLLQPSSAFQCFSRARISKENFKINRHLLLWVLLNIQTSLRKRPLKTVLVQLRAWRLRFLKDDLVYQRRRLLNIKATSSFFRWLFYHAFYLEYGGERLASRLPFRCPDLTCRELFHNSLSLLNPTRPELCKRLKRSEKDRLGISLPLARSCALSLSLPFI